MKTTLIITGQLRLNNQNPIDKINYHINKLNPDETILFLWQNEYQQYKKEINQLNLQTIILNKNLPLITEEQINLCLKHINQQPNTINPILYNKPNIDFFIRLIKQYYLIQYTFQNLNTTSDIYIKTRYDLHYLSDFNINPLTQFYNENKPIISTPFGGDLFGIGLGDLMTITNNKANNIYKNYYDSFINLLQENKCPINAEFLIRYIFKNLNHSDIYRFNFFCTTEYMMTNNHIYHGLKQYGEIIGKDNLYLPNYNTV